MNGYVGMVVLEISSGRYWTLTELNRDGFSWDCESPDCPSGGLIYDEEVGTNRFPIVSMADEYVNNSPAADGWW